MIEAMLAHSCSLDREVATGTNGRTVRQTLYSGIKCLFMPMSAEAAIRNNFEVGYAWHAYFADGADVKIGDRLTWNGTPYLVRGVRPYIGIGGVSHIEIDAETEHSSGR